ncbi:efflux RND transporter periplasmic adaptor subunit [Tabrizicola soli]|uniref:Efflux RND transporter periplasmic adaptor subunit n=1 Tax=Tabrizicola soli TaxID=2185115 RepID=A0ABV7DZG2_9RHOB|nr:HlyD family efflux transporter periplasmic adaptor subunit [Tabrizicola soli]
MNLRQGSLWGIAGLALVAATVWALWPAPLEVDLGRVATGPMRGTVLAEGVTRVRDPFSVSAPISGTMQRSPVEVGDPVTKGETVLAVIRPAAPVLMDARSRAQAEAAVTEARAALALAETGVTVAAAALSQAESQLARGRALAASGTIPQRSLEELETAQITASQRLAAARSEVDLARASLVRAEAQLIGPTLGAPEADPGECCLRLTAPHDGVVLTLADPSERPVQAGEPLMTLGDLTELEIVVDLLSSDAVQVAPGMVAEVDRWGGPGTLAATVRRVAPSAVTKISALGIEEQRVRVHLDLTDPPGTRPGLGDGFRVYVRLLLWHEESVLQVPQSALFRHGEGWAVFRLDAGKARLVPVGIGRQVEDSAEVVSGLQAGETVVIFPSSALQDGAAITPRAP